MKLKVEKSKGLEEGTYRGTITAVVEKVIETRDGKVPYMDIFIKPDVVDFEIKYGCSQKVTEQSKLGKLLSKFVDLSKVAEVDPELILTGKKVSFMVKDKETPQGVFAEIVEDTIKPAKEGA